MKKYKFLIIILSITFMINLAGCSFKMHSLNNLSTTVYVDSIGMDYNKETNKYTLYYHTTASFSLISSEMGSIGSSTTYCIASSEKDNIYEAIKEIALNTNRNILLTHIRSVIFTLDFINNENLTMFNNFIKSYKYINIDFNVYATDSDIKELFSFRNPETTNSYYSIITELDNIIPFNVIKYNTFASSMYEDYRAVKFIYISIKDDVWNDNIDKLKTLYTKGYVYFKNNKLIELESSYFKFINLMYGNYETHLIFNDVCYTLINPTLKVTENKVKLKALVYISKTNNKSDEELLNDLKYNLMREFKSLYYYTINNNFDIFYIKDRIYRKNKLKNDFKLEDIEFSFEFNLKILS